MVLLHEYPLAVFIIRFVIDFLGHIDKLTIILHAG